MFCFICIKSVTQAIFNTVYTNVQQAEKAFNAANGQRLRIESFFI